MNHTNAIKAEGLIVEHDTAAGLFRALDCPQFTVTGGSSVAITGPSGCGKSTLLGVLAGLAVPTSGSITIGATEITALSEADRAEFRKKIIGVVYQVDNLLPFLTVYENIQLQLVLNGHTENTESRITELLDRLGLSEIRERLPDQLSGGQRQRVAIARAVAHRPSVLLADEPTGSLDDENTAIVVQLLLEMHQHLRSTLIVVTHAPSVASRMERLITLREGSIISDSEVIYDH
jgi:putative ABC transport system ATP-binding protein